MRRLRLLVGSRRVGHRPDGSGDVRCVQRPALGGVSPSCGTRHYGATALRAVRTATIPPPNARSSTLWSMNITQIQLWLAFALTVVLLLRQAQAVLRSARALRLIR